MISDIVNKYTRLRHKASKESVPQGPGVKRCKPEVQGPVRKNELTGEGRVLKLYGRFADFNIDLITQEFSFSGGLFLQDKVTKLMGKYKYTGAENDSASVIIYCFK